jgi:hypothetical protein
VTHFDLPNLRDQLTSVLKVIPDTPRESLALYCQPCDARRVLALDGDDDALDAIMSGFTRLHRTCGERA